MLSVKKITSINEFSRLKGDWETLLKQSKSDTVFLTWEWMYTWWECFKENKKLFILTVHDQQDNFLGIAPLCVDKKKIAGITVLNYIRFLGTVPISSDHLDFIIYHGREREALEAIVNYLFQEKIWDICLFSNIPISSLTDKFLKEIIGNRPYQSEISQVCPFIPLPSRIEDFYSSLSKNTRNTIKRKKRNLNKKCNGFELVVWENIEDLDNAMEKLFELNQKRWMSMEHKGSFARNDVREFHKKIAKTFLSSDMLRLYFLRVHGEDVATLYTFKYNNKLFYYQSGRDPNWIRDSVGIILTNLVIEDAVNKGYSEYDFLRGLELYKTQLTDKKREEIDIFIINSLKAKIYLILRNIYYKIKRLRSR